MVDFLNGSAIPLGRWTSGPPGRKPFFHRANGSRGSHLKSTLSFPR
jgi:hypothetical protein